VSRRRLLWLLPFVILLPLVGWPVARRFSSIPSEDALSGIVTANGQPVAGARVRLQTTEHFAETDPHGRFRFPHQSNQGRLTAWKEGFFIAGIALDAKPLSLSLTRLPEHDANDYDWVDPAPQRGGLHNCAHCHAEIYQEWTTSAHSRAASGKHFRNLYDGMDWHGKPEATWSLLDQHPNGAAVCSSCHAPAIPSGDPALFDLRELRGVAAKGVHCDYCHKVSGVGEDDKLGLTHGRFDLKLLRPAKAKDDEEQRQIFFGPLDDVDRGEDAYSPLYKQSRYCASCHEAWFSACRCTRPIPSGLPAPRGRPGNSARTAT
jgi:hypothetical protein